MLFNSAEFVLFLGITWPLYRLLQRSRVPRMLWLLLISYFFYGCWHPWYLSLIALSTLQSYWAGLKMEAAREEHRIRWMWVGVCADLLLLGIFKYGNFTLDNLAWILGALGLYQELPRVPGELPVGISFYTFQTLSYTIDLYKRRIPPAESLLDFATYVAFFPQLVAGPIVRAREFLPQLKGAPPRQDPALIGEGVFWILCGLSKKMILADLLATRLVEPFFMAPAGRSSAEATVALWAANFQVYMDFSGYSDVAVGAALLFGYQLPMNFNRPFQSRSPMEHWRRWHISLSTWLKDYLYIPLGGSRRGRWRTDLNLTLTFLLGGLWHGAGWTFVLWGLYNGLLLVAWRRWAPAPAESRIGRALERFLTFNSICLGLVFLHTPDMALASDAFGSLLRLWGGPAARWDAVGLGVLAGVTLLHFSPGDWKDRLRARFGEQPGWVLGWTVVIWGGVLSLFAGLAKPFFYFQF